MMGVGAKRALRLYRSCAPRHHIGRAARAIGRTLEFDDDGAIDEAVEHRHSERSISQVFGTCIEINVGDEDSRTGLVSAGDNFVEKVRCLRTLFTLDAVESELVDDEDVPLCVMFEGFVESLISHGLSPAPAAHREVQVVQSIAMTTITESTVEDVAFDWLRARPEPARRNSRDRPGIVLLPVYAVRTQKRAAETLFLQWPGAKLARDHPLSTRGANAGWRTDFFV